MEPEISKPRAEHSTWSALALAWELGYTIAIPIVIFAIGGRFLDKKLGSSPIFLLLGILLALIVSGVGVYRRTKRIMNQEL
ncbi:MAG: AtpZ/AtpI family protein [Patescibacteria group bacterium]